METCTQAQEADYKQKTRALLFLRSPEVIYYIWCLTSPRLGEPVWNHLAPFTQAPNTHGVPSRGMEAGGDGHSQDWPFNLPSHHTYCDLLLKSPAVILSVRRQKKQVARGQQPAY